MLVLHGHSVFSSPPQRPMTFDFQGISSPDFIHYIFSPYLNSSERASTCISLFNVQCLTRELLVPFLKRLWYDAVLDWGLNPGPPALQTSTLPQGYRGGRCIKCMNTYLESKYDAILFKNVHLSPGHINHGRRHCSGCYIAGTYTRNCNTQTFQLTLTRFATIS